MPTVYRIIREKFINQPLSIEGSRLFGARWNPKGTGVLYTTSTPELGLVETLAHAPNVRYEELPTYWLFSIEAPDNILYYQRNEMPDFWQDETYDRSQMWLRDWLQNPGHPAVAVPSVIVPFSYNIIFHPLHSQFAELRIIDQEIIPIDRRLWKA